jgi:hypothetical protein
MNRIVILVGALAICLLLSVANLQPANASAIGFEKVAATTPPKPGFEKVLPSSKPVVNKKQSPSPVASPRLQEKSPRISAPTTTYTSSVRDPLWKGSKSN